jgi:hypothetical protein
MCGQADQYALVAYIEGQLGDFLLNLRQEIVPSCQLRSHVSILPPRTLAGTEEEAIAFIREMVPHLSAFEVKLGEVEVFPVTNVIYISVDAGLANLHAKYKRLNADALAFTERYPYHPHVTLAQELAESEQAEALEVCKARWQEYDGPRSFPVETLTFVHYNAECGWQDLAEIRLEMAGSRL